MNLIRDYIGAGGSLHKKELSGCQKNGIRHVMKPESPENPTFSIFGKSLICYTIFIEIINLKAPWNYSASFGTNNNLICLWENPKTLISMISGFWDVSPAPKTNYFHL